MLRGDLNKVEIKRGDVFFADLNGVRGSEQGGTRPIVVLQNDMGNKFSSTIIIASVTSKINKCKMPTHVLLSADEYGLDKDSVIMLEQIRTIDKARICGEKITSLDSVTMKKIDMAMMISLGVIDMPVKRNNNTSNRKMVAAV